MFIAKDVWLPRGSPIDDPVARSSPSYTGTYRKPWKDNVNVAKDTTNLILHGIGPLLIMPVTRIQHAEALSFFEYISIKNLNIHPSISWQHILVYFSSTIPSVRGAAIALALIHQTIEIVILCATRDSPKSIQRIRLPCLTIAGPSNFF